MSEPVPQMIAPNPAGGFALWLDRYRHWVFGIVLLAYLGGFNGIWRIEPDSALYLSLGRNLAEGRGYTYHDQPHRLAYPGLPWLHACLFKVFGTETLVPQHVLMLLMALATLGLVYRLFLLHADRPTAVVICAGLAGMKTFYRFAFELRNDMPFMLGAMAFLCGYEAVAKRQTRPIRPIDWFFLIGGLAWALATRPTAWALLAAALIAVVLQAILRPAYRWRAVIAVAVLVGMAILFRAVDPRTSLSDEAGGQYEAFVRQSFTTQLVPTLQSIATEKIPQLLLRATSDAMFQVRFGWANALLSLWLIGCGVLLVKQRLLWGIWIAVTVVMMAAILPLDRIYLPVLPLMLYGWWRSIVWICDRLPSGRWCWTGFILLLLLGAGSNSSKVGGYILQQRSPRFYQHFDEGAHAPLIRLAREIRTIVPPDSAVLMQHNYARAMSYLSQRDVYDRRDLNELKPAGKSIFIVEPNNPIAYEVLTANGLAPGSILAEVGPWRLRSTQPIK